MNKHLIHSFLRRRVIWSTPTKLVRPIKICLNETYCKDHRGKLLSDAVPNQSGLKKGNPL